MAKESKIAATTTTRDNDDDNNKDRNNDRNNDNNKITNNGVSFTTIAIVVAVFAVVLGILVERYNNTPPTTTTIGISISIYDSISSIIMGSALTKQCNTGNNISAIKSDIASIISKDMKRRNDGTSLIGTFVRLAWHSSGTYSVRDSMGGSNGGRIRHEPERSWDANAGLTVAMDALEPIKHRHPQISYADIYVLSGVVAIEEAGGPENIPFALGRSDDIDGSSSPPSKDRLPDADRGTFESTAEHMRDVFHRMGFCDREMVCLIGAHTLGRCHTDRSGYWGPWNKAENKFNNALFKFLLDMEWTVKETHQGKPWTGPLQYENPSGELMMLPSCITMIKDEKLKKYVVMYAKDEELFFKDFAEVFGKLISLGLPHKPRYRIF